MNETHEKKYNKNNNNNINTKRTGTKKKLNEKNIYEIFLCTFCTVRMPNEFYVEVFTLNVIQTKAK